MRKFASLLMLILALASASAVPVEARAIGAGRGAADPWSPAVRHAEPTAPFGVSQQSQPVATLEQSGWAVVARVSGPDSLRVRNDQGASFTVWHIGIIGPFEGQGDWREQATRQQQALLPVGTRVYLAAEPGIESSTSGVALRHVFTADDRRTPIAAKLLAAGSVWVYPDGIHAYVDDFADQQAAAVVERSGAWSETRSTAIFRPRGAAHGGYPIDPQVRPALEALDASELGHSLLVAVNQFPPEIGVSGRRADVLGSFSRREYSIQLAPDIMSADPVSISAVLYHELVHARQMVDQYVDDESQTCFQREQQAFEAQANYWISINGPRGLVPANHPLDRDLNRVVQTYNRGTLDAWVWANYADQCRD